MALMNCKECGREVSHYARKCPGCGAPNKAGEDDLSLRSVKTLLSWVAVMIVLVWVFYG